MRRNKSECTPFLCSYFGFTSNAVDISYRLYDAISRQGVITAVNHSVMKTPRSSKINHWVDSTEIVQFPLELLELVYY